MSVVLIFVVPGDGLTAVWTSIRVRPGGPLRLSAGLPSGATIDLELFEEAGREDDRRERRFVWLEGPMDGAHRHRDAPAT